MSAHDHHHHHHQQQQAAEAQEVLEKLTMTIKRLRDERKVLKQSLDSSVQETVQMRKQTQSQFLQWQKEKEVLEDQVANMNALNTKMMERCDKLELLYKLCNLKRHETAEDMKDTIVAWNADKKKMKDIETAVQLKEEKLIAKENKLLVENKRLHEYINKLETEVQTQYNLRVDEVEKMRDLHSEYKLAHKEISILKILGLNSPADAAKAFSLSPNATNQEKFIVMKHELQQATEFLRHACSLVEGNGTGNGIHSSSDRVGQSRAAQRYK